MKVAVVAFNSARNPFDVPNEVLHRETVTPFARLEAALP
jgi:hypothetical protein